MVDRSDITEQHCMVDLSGVIDTVFDGDEPTITNQHKGDAQALSDIGSCDEGQDDAEQQESTAATGIASDSCNNVAAETESNTIAESLAIAPNNNSNTQSHEGSMDTSTGTALCDTASAKWYFVPDPKNNYDLDTKDGIQTVVKFNCSTEYESRYFGQGNIEASSLPNGVYEVVFGVSIRNFHVDKVKMITFVLIEECSSKRKEHDNATSVVDTGILELHYMEFRPYRFEGYPDESSITKHRPYLWSLDVRSIGHFSEGGTQHIPGIILTFTVSGNGRYVATLASTETPLTFLLILWDMKNVTGTDEETGRAIKGNNQEDPPQNASSFQPKACAGRVVFVPGAKDPEKDRDFHVSLSWDGSMVAVSERMKYLEAFPKTILSVYHHEGNNKHPQTIRSQTIPTTGTVLQPLSDQLLCAEIDSFQGYGIFHMQDSKNVDVKKELFLACDKERVLIFSMYPKWRHLHTITTVHRKYSWRMIGLQGQFLATTHTQYEATMVWDITPGSVGAILPKDDNFYSRWDTVAFSDDGSLMAAAIGKQTSVSLYWTAAWIMIGSCSSPTEGSSIFNMRFIQNDTHILAYIGFDDSHLKEEAIIIEIPSMTIVDRVIIPQAYAVRNLCRIGSEISFYSAYEATLDLLPSYIQPRAAYSDRCLTNLTPVEDKGIVITNQQPTELAAPSGLLYRFEMQSTFNFSTGNERTYLVVSIARRNDTPLKTITIPIWHYKCKDGMAVLLSSSLRLVVTSLRLIVIWQLPESLDDGPKLETVMHVDKSYHCMTCVHWELYGVAEDQGQNQDQNQGKNQDRDDVEIQYFRITKCFAFTNVDWVIDTVVSLFRGADTDCGTTILQYIAPHINSCYDTKYPSDSLMATICRKWKEYWFNLPQKTFLPDLLALPGTRWALRPDTALESNPLWILFERAKTELRFMGTVESLIDYCFCRARANKDLALLFPVLQCLHILVDPKDLHTVLGTQVLARFAYLPSKHRKYIIDHHTIVHPPQFRWRFWKSSTRPIYQCTGPIMQLANNYKHDILNKKFTRQLCTAPFGLLWRYKGNVVYKPDRSSTWSRNSPSWIRMLVALTWYKCKLMTEKHVHCHDFSLEMLDNPAIAALIEYKWNTIGFNYCMIRFVFQCCYYLLVLTVVLLQVYGGHNGTLFGAFIAIAVCSVLFLWLELIQILFELRINKNVCKFVTIIIRVFARIRLFFFIAFGATLAFAIALLHLLHSCPFESCGIESKFPSHFYGAISATILYMGGRYDSIEDELNSDNWPFQTLMVVFFFFTVVLMLNVLIALINKAFIDGDETWRLVWLQNRLRVIESVENLSFHLPGFREHYNYFPDEIYYSATAKEIEDLQAMYPRDFGNPDPAKNSFKPTTNDEPNVNSVAVFEKPNKEMKEELKQVKEQMAALQVQNAVIQGQNKMMQDQMRELQVMMSTLLSSKTDS
ncbi:hypothetical protein BGZ50_004911 [Haplosporangium sp. Z 11]|nr:hypothetical protein BGZ50_004911 [Haplosporangium sp. Z 11]